MTSPRPCPRCGAPGASAWCPRCAYRCELAVARLLLLVEIREDLVAVQVRPARRRRARTSDEQWRGGALCFGPDGTPAGRSERWRVWAAP